MAPTDSRPASPSQGSVPFSDFDGLFVRSLKVTPESELGQALRAAGLDLANPEPRYSKGMWSKCLDIAASHKFPGLERNAAHRKLARHMFYGFLDTMGGKVFAALLPRLTPAAFVEQVPQLINMGRVGLQMTAVRAGERQYRLEVRNIADPIHGYFAGLIETGLTHLKVQPKITHVHRGPQDFDLDITW